MDSKARKQIDKLLADAQKKFGKEVIIRGNVVDPNIIRIHSGSLDLDRALGWHPQQPHGGWPCGRISEIWGPEAAGKTTLTIHAMANAQLQFPDKVCVFVDAENTFNPEYAERLGVNVEEIIYVVPDHAQHAIEIINEFAKFDLVSMIVLDSVAAMTPRQVLEGDVGAAHVGLLARLMSQHLSQLQSLIRASGVAVLFVNQTRQSIGTMGYGPKETTPGGNALKFVYSTRARVSRIASIKEKEEPIGNKTIVEMRKNKVGGRPFMKAKFDILFGHGIDKAAELLDIGSDLGLVSKTGAGNYTFPDGSSIRGRNAAKLSVVSIPELVDQIINVYVQKVVSEGQLGKGPVTNAATEGDDDGE